MHSCSATCTTPVFRSNPSATTWFPVVTGLQDGPQWSLSAGLHTLMWSSPMPAWSGEPGRKDSVPRLGLAYKRHSLVLLLLFIRAFALAEGSYYIVSSPEERTLWAPTEAPCQPAWVWPQILQQIQPSDTSTATSWETWSQNHPMKPLPDSCLSETRWNHNYLWLPAVHVGRISYAALEN